MLDGDVPSSLRASPAIAKPQSARHSLLEAVVSTCVGFLVSLATQIVLYPLFGFNAPLTTDLSLAALFTVISVVRGFLVRRAFNGAGLL